jgi:hypothetical protein
MLATAALALALAATSGPAVYTDPTGDAKTAPDVAKVTVDLDGGSGALKFDVEFAGAEQLVLGGGFAIVLDTDRNAGTGDRTGADYWVEVHASGALMLKWNGSDMVPFDHQPMVVARTPGKVTLAFCSCDLGTQTFDFAVVGFRGNDIDVAPDTGASFPIPAIEIQSFLYSPTPLFPKAGKRFTLKPLGIRLGGSSSELVLPDSLVCAAKLAGRSLKGTGAGGCSWLLPKKGRGKKLVVSVNVSYQGASETFTQTFRVT